MTRQRDRVFVEKFVVKHLSSKLAAEELGGVKLRQGVDDNVTVSIYYISELALLINSDQIT